MYISTDGAASAQGSMLLPAGNQFSLTARNYDIYSSSKIISYFTAQNNTPLLFTTKRLVFL